MNDVRFVFLLTLLSISVAPVLAEDAQRFQPLDVFELEFAGDPQISPDGERVVYTRTSMDIMKDRRRSDLWVIDASGERHRPLGNGDGSDSSPRWSPSGDRLLYLSRDGNSTQLFVRWMDTGQTARLSHLSESPNGIAWSPDGTQIAFSMLVPAKEKPLAKVADKPQGARWADPPKVIQQLTYRADGQGYLENGYYQLFVLSADGGTPRQVTHGAFHHQGPPSWTPDGKTLVFSANRREDWWYHPVNSEVYALDLETEAIEALTDRVGPDANPVVSPDGRRIAYLGFDDRKQGYQVTHLYVMDRQGANVRRLATGLDRDVASPLWAGDGRGLYFSFDDEGETRIALADLDGGHRVIAGNMGGTTLGRPYPGGSFSVARNGGFAYTRTSTDRPADLAVGQRRGEPRVLTALNEDVLGHRVLPEIEEIWFESSFDQRRVHGWIAKPPGFNAAKKYPLILEIHGGPFANYGARFSPEVQLYAAAGYVVLYTNPRGSTSYGEEFGNLIHHNYPGQDYDDLMSGVDAVIERGYIDTDRLYVTGGSGGGVLTSWIVGKTDRFRAAVVQKPVINWYSFVLTSDFYNFFHQYWFSAPPWENPEEYLRRSPISLVGNVTTPTMLLTGEADYRTPISESEQYYQALRLRKVDTALVRVPEAPHFISGRPSHLIAKVAHIVAWFERYGGVE